ncbi:hypothetical protein LRP30_13645 [Bradyrhizobium sp. C-145]|uniref:hypothetical protein n=1 Tax=Bradyrhizobium sp. C-145 TaxID=574727 RepID=UPI00201B598B|nr:hypothetical protein [Bradyrhizobium sp. C-145]UQR66226.1 hypothetical protein LRP30_13645 [Bradyrhizobium sp. C-145]
MKYHQPYGVTDPNAGYVNGDPSVGRFGSIPPAEAIEYTQREIANLIGDVAFTPTDADMHQLAKAIQSSRLNYSTDFGTSNAYVAHLTPTPDDYYTGMEVRLKIGNSNAGDSTLACYPLAPKHIVRPDGTNLQIYDLVVGQIARFIYDGVQWVLATVNAGGSGGPIYLTAPRTYYVNVATGNDAYDGLSATVINATNGPFRTLQRAASAIEKFNLNGYNVDVYVADGGYDRVSLPAVSGAGHVYWHGNTANPTNCTISGVDTDAAIGVGGQANQMDGFSVGCSGNGALHELNGVYAGAGATVILTNFEWRACGGAQNRCVNGGQIRFSGGVWRITGGSSGNGFSPGCFVTCEQAGKFDVGPVSAPPALTITGTPAYGTSFLRSFDVGIIDFIYSSLSGGATGQRYYAATNGVINTSGGGASYVPGNVAGFQGSGGQYI